MWKIFEFSRQKSTNRARIPKISFRWFLARIFIIWKISNTVNIFGAKIQINIFVKNFWLQKSKNDFSSANFHVKTKIPTWRTLEKCDKYFRMTSSKKLKKRAWSSIFFQKIVSFFVEKKTTFRAYFLALFSEL